MAVSWAELCHLSAVEMLVRKESHELHEGLVPHLTASIIRVDTECLRQWHTPLMKQGGSLMKQVGSQSC